VKKLLGALGLMLALTQSAHAYSLSCGDVMDAIRFGTDQDATMIGVYSLGVGDMVGTLACFVGDPSCPCLSNLDARASDFGRAFGQRLVSCPRSDPAVGQIFNAAFDVCR